ncbi:unnamed protein product [Cladocopium goreaui]|uniref:Uncharacterized protein n=1 Tax=Cladocopium goreaui TaxID=2562237 RepID=A0A9P1CQ17_9DINO|nr:unnamed protein product [Cladocopium goreaui]
MGQENSKVTQDHPVRMVPTTTTVNKAGLQSKWWNLQVSGAAPAPACLEGYGRQYAALFERHCGEHRKDHQRCMRKGKFDPLDMKTWYPVCGEPYEVETACAVSLLKEVDVRCRAQLDSAADAVGHGQAPNPKLTKQLESVGQCMAQLGADKHLKLTVDTAQAKERFRLSKQLLAR